MTKTRSQPFIVNGYMLMISRMLNNIKIAAAGFGQVQGLHWIITKFMTISGVPWEPAAERTLHCYALNIPPFYPHTYTLLSGLLGGQGWGKQF